MRHRRIFGLYCVCRNSIVDKLVEECANVIDENKI